AQAVQAMVDAIRAGVGRARHLCTAGEPGAGAFVVAVAPDAGRDLARDRASRRDGYHGTIVPRLADRAHFDIPDQPFRTVRPAPGCQQPQWPANAGAAVSGAALLPFRAASDLS